jgi:hypothetical protein
MKKFNYIFFFLSIFLVMGKGVAFSKDLTNRKPSIVLLIGVEKVTSAHGVTIQTPTATDKVIFHFDLKKWGKGTLRISDARGNILLEKEIKDWTIGINLQDAAPGFYNVTLEKDHLLEIVEIRKE